VLADVSSALRDTLALAERAGAPAVDLLRSSAQQARRDARVDGMQLAAALGVRLMLPLGVCVLPSFMLIGVAPMVLSIVSSTVGAI
jgi:tight adherence protein B